MKAEYTGLKVPASAIRMINGETGVYVLDVVTVRFRTAKIIYSTDNSYIVRLPEDTDEPENEEEEEEGAKKTPALRLHDNIIIEGKGLYEVSTVLTGKLLEREISEADHKKLIDSVIDEIGAE